MTEQPQFSRSRREKKRRNSKRKFLFFASLAVIFGIFLLSLIILGNKEEPVKETTANTSSEEKAKENTDTKEVEENNKDEDNENNPVEQTDVSDRVEVMDKQDSVEVEVIPSNDANVIKAYTGNWKPIGTEQTGEHTTNYNDQSSDRIEIKNAVAKVTEVPMENIIEHWVGNDGEQKVVATIQNEETSEYYNVYLEWVNEEGWKPTKVEELKGWNGPN